MCVFAIKLFQSKTCRGEGRRIDATKSAVDVQFIGSRKLIYALMFGDNENEDNSIRSKEIYLTWLDLVIIEFAILHYGAISLSKLVQVYNYGRFARVIHCEEMNRVVNHGTESPSYNEE